ncbi:unnamed protein product [Arctogadus glacialis]
MADNIEKTHNWTNEETRALIEWRAANEALFTGRRNSSVAAWEDFISTSGLVITTKQAQKKWNNLKGNYKELRDPPHRQRGRGRYSYCWHLAVVWCHGYCTPGAALHQSAPGCCSKHVCHYRWGS